MTTKPTYLTATKLATEIGINPNRIGTILKKWKHHPHNPTPKADAYYIVHDNKIPLWLPTRLPEWHQWKTKRDTLVTETHAQERANTLARQTREEHA